MGGVAFRGKSFLLGRLQWCLAAPGCSSSLLATGVRSSYAFYDWAFNLAESAIALEVMAKSLYMLIQLIVCVSASKVSMLYLADMAKHDIFF